jgi:DNA-binding transcriptional ArsR family regulator
MAEPVSADVLRALSHPLRLALLVALEQGELSVPELAEHVGLRTGEVVPHLACLRAAGLVLDGAHPGLLRTSTDGWAAVDRQLRRLAAEADPPAEPS